MATKTVKYYTSERRDNTDESTTPKDLSPKDNTDWSKLDLQKVYDLLGKLLSENSDYEIRFKVRRKDEENGI